MRVPPVAVVVHRNLSLACSHTRFLVMPLLIAGVRIRETWWRFRFGIEWVLRYTSLLSCRWA